ncbi:hypothetical protein D3C73_1217250 [compost metagenome]
MRIHIEADGQGRVGIPGSKLRIETLGPTVDFGNRCIGVGVVAMQVEVAGVHLEVTVIDEICMGRRTDHPQHAGNTEPTARLLYLIHPTSPHLYVPGHCIYRSSVKRRTKRFLVVMAPGEPDGTIHYVGAPKVYAR